MIRAVILWQSHPCMLGDLGGSGDGWGEYVGVSFACERDVDLLTQWFYFSP